MHNLVKQHLPRAQERMKRQADKHRSERNFSVGDMVYLNLQPYIQSSVATRANQKLPFRFFGPFRMTDKVGLVAYKLSLPPSSTVHPVFHVSQLKQAAPADEQVTPSLPNLNDGLHIPLQVLQRRLSADGKVDEVLNRWSSMPSTLATWENAADLKRRFPGAPAWGQARLYWRERGGGGCQQPC